MNDRHDLNRLHDQARARAHAERAQAIDDFWSALDAGFASLSHDVHRSAERLAHRLAHHSARRADEPADLAQHDARGSC